MLYEEFPNALGFSMSPFGYVVTVHKTTHTATDVTYTCYRDGCKFAVSIDPRDMTLEFVRGLMRQHVDEEH